MTSKRAKSSSPRRAPVAPPESPSLGEADLEPRWVVPLGLAWLVVFCLFFYSFELPNNREDWSRIEIWMRLPQLLPLRQVFEAPWRN
ncbi:MAG TPA: hypothetical protein VEI07_10745, partial [Planctomycetaceae bacterium]|nr:hypothetical protein [Planctomycetaceae bacterium]